MNIKKHIVLLIFFNLLTIHLWSQDIEITNEDNLLEQNLSIVPGVSLVQFGNQNTADIIQFDSYFVQLSLYQEGDYNSARVIQSGSGFLNISQYGLSNHIESHLVGEDIEVQLYQQGQGNDIKQWSNGNNANYQFIQYGIENTIEHLNNGGNNAGLYIEQRGNDMTISVITQ